mmetsp:Transcript_35943/g.90508  ORF Transcript_35943/g.90508 Transcript_35943/m.90508 type:complete len:220 (-) Transcript_35943:711-1370(-)
MQHMISLSSSPASTSLSSLSSPSQPICASASSLLACSSISVTSAAFTVALSSTDLSFVSTGLLSSMALAATRSTSLLATDSACAAAAPWLALARAPSAFCLTTSQVLSAFSSAWTSSVSLSTAALRISCAAWSSSSTCLHAPLSWSLSPGAIWGKSRVCTSWTSFFAAACSSRCAARLLLASASRFLAASRLFSTAVCAESVPSLLAAASATMPSPEAL